MDILVFLIAINICIFNNIYNNKNYNFYIKVIEFIKNIIMFFN